MSAKYGDMIMSIGPHPGWQGVFTTWEYPGAMPNGTRVEKCGWEKNDSHELGAKATVLGSIGHQDIGIAYFVEFDDHPRTAVLIVAAKVRAEKTQ